MLYRNPEPDLPPPQMDMEPGVGQSLCGILSKHKHGDSVFHERTSYTVMHDSLVWGHFFKLFVCCDVCAVKVIIGAAVLLNIIHSTTRRRTHSAGCISQSERCEGSCVSGQRCQSGTLKMAGCCCLQVSPRVERWQDIHYELV